MPGIEDRRDALFMYEGLHIGIFSNMPEEVQKKKADGIVGDPNQGVFVRDKGTDKTEIYEGGNKP